jgi:hypothetical protein
MIGPTHILLARFKVLQKPLQNLSDPLTLHESPDPLDANASQVA